MYEQIDSIQVSTLLRIKKWLVHYYYTLIQLIMNYKGWRWKNTCMYINISNKKILIMGGEKLMKFFSFNM